MDKISFTCVLCGYKIQLNKIVFLLLLIDTSKSKGGN